MKCSVTICCDGKRNGIGWFARRLKDGKGDRGSIAGLFVGLVIACPSLENLCKSVMETRLLP